MKLEGVDWIALAQNRVQSRALWSFLFRKSIAFSTMWVTINFSRFTLHHGVTYFPWCVISCCTTWRTQKHFGLNHI